MTLHMHTISVIKFKIKTNQNDKTHVSHKLITTDDTDTNSNNRLI